MAVQVLLLHDEFDPDRPMLEGVDVSSAPEFRIGEVCRIFLGRSAMWLRWSQKEGRTKLGDTDWANHRTDLGARTFTLVDIEMLVLALASNGAISGLDALLSLRIVKCVARLYKLIE